MSMKSFSVLTIVALQSVPCRGWGVASNVCIPQSPPPGYVLERLCTAGGGGVTPPPLDPP